jgi:parallel beta-helix repeat protein
MRRDLRRSSLPLYLTFALWLVCFKSPAQSNMVYLSSPSGDYIGQGATYYTTNPADIAISGSLPTVTMWAFGYSIEIDAPDASNLAVGVYTNASRYPFNGSQPGLTVSGNGRGCNNVSGQFEIHEIHTNNVGQVDRFWATFSHSCEGVMPAMVGDLRVNSTLAPLQPVAQIRRVPQDYPTIQGAIDAANVVADTVLVSAGAYVESIDFHGKSVHVVSVNGPAQTIIRPTTAGGVAVNFSSGEQPDAILSGFTITNGSIQVNSASPTICSNRLSASAIGSYFASPTIISNWISGYPGYGIYLQGAASATVAGNLIELNSGGGITMFAAGTPNISNNVIRNNLGNGMDMSNYSDANILQNIITGNKGAGIYWLVPSGNRGPYVINNTIVGNISAGISADGYDGASLVMNNIIGGSPALYVGSFNDSNPPIIQFNEIYSTNGAAYSGLITDRTGPASMGIFRMRLFFSTRLPTTTGPDDTPPGSMLDRPTRPYHRTSKGIHGLLTGMESHRHCRIWVRTSLCLARRVPQPPCMHFPPPQQFCWTGGRLMTPRITFSAGRRTARDLFRSSPVSPVQTTQIPTRFLVWCISTWWPDRIHLAWVPTPLRFRYEQGIILPWQAMTPLRSMKIRSP